MLKFFLVTLFATFFLASAFMPARLMQNGAVSSRDFKSKVSMGLFDGLFGKKKTASASHILVKGNNGPEFLTQLKKEISAKKDVKAAFAEAAASYSACPSAKKGGALGTFSQGQMVPAFDKVVFSEDIGVIHG
jgi:peptidyl-prolyl cis-trans isomerase C